MKNKVRSGFAILLLALLYYLASGVSTSKADDLELRKIYESLKSQNDHFNPFWVKFEMNIFRSKEFYEEIYGVLATQYAAQEKATKESLTPSSPSEQPCQSLEYTRFIEIANKADKQRFADRTPKIFQGHIVGEPEDRVRVFDGKMGVLDEHDFYLIASDTPLFKITSDKKEIDVLPNPLGESGTYLPYLLLRNYPEIDIARKA